MSHILIIEDDIKIAKLLMDDLELEGYKVSAAKDGLEGLEMARTKNPDLVLLDVMLPKMSGYDVCRTLRKEKYEFPIIMLTAKGHETEKVFGFDLGADDYITKPFSGIELLARVKAHLRRHTRERNKVETYKFGDVKIDFRKMEATKEGKDIALTAKEFQILEVLIRYRGEVVSRRQFLDEVWDNDELISSRKIDNQILNLRNKLTGSSKEDPFIVTIHGVGYKFVG